MNVANKITMSRVFLSIAIMIILLFPWYQVGIEMPEYIIHGNIVVNLKFIIAGVLFIIASLTDFVDGKVARKYNMVTDFGKMVDSISDKLLTNTVLIILACGETPVINPVIVVIIIARDIIVDSIKMLIGNKGKAVGAIKVAKYKTASLMVGLVLKLFYDLPFSYFGFEISDYLLIIAAVLSIISGAKYYMMAREYIMDK